MSRNESIATSEITPPWYPLEEPDSRAIPGDAQHLPARDPLRDEEWFAQQIGKSAQWCRKHRAGLPHHVIGESVRYDDHCVDLYREQTFHPASSPQTGPRGDQMLPTALSARHTRGAARSPW